MSKLKNKKIIITNLKKKGNKNYILTYICKQKSFVVCKIQLEITLFGI